MKQLSGARRCAFTLIEILVAISVLSILMTLLTSVFVALFGLSHSQLESERRVNGQHSCADQFRDDVAQTIEMPSASGVFKASPECLILKRADGDIIIYRLGEDMLERTSEASPQSIRRFYLGNGLTVGFNREAEGGRLISLRCSRALDNSDEPAREATEICAALGGDLR